MTRSSCTGCCSVFSGLHNSEIQCDNGQQVLEFTMPLFHRLLFHLQPVILLSSIPITFAGILYVWNFFDPFSNYQPEIDLDRPGEQLASLTPMIHAIVRCSYAMFGSAAGFSIARICAHQLPLRDELSPEQRQRANRIDETQIRQDALENESN